MWEENAVKFRFLTTVSPRKYFMRTTNQWVYLSKWTIKLFVLPCYNCGFLGYQFKNNRNNRVNFKDVGWNLPSNSLVFGSENPKGNRSTDQKQQATTLQYKKKFALQDQNKCVSKKYYVEENIVNLILQYKKSL